MRNIDKVIAVVEKNALGLDDDEIAEKTGIAPRQQVHQLCSKLAAQGRIERRSVEKNGKRKKIHNFPVGSEVASGGRTVAGAPHLAGRSWERRLAAIEAATSLNRDEILDRALTEFAVRLLRTDLGGAPSGSPFHASGGEPRVGHRLSNSEVIMVPFDVFWQRLKDECATWESLEGASRAKAVRKWSADKGDMDGQFVAVWSGGDTLLCNTEDTNSPRSVSRAEFEKVYNVWQDYTGGAKGRSVIAHDLGVQNATWIIPILHRHEHLMH